MNMGIKYRANGYIGIREEVNVMCNLGQGIEERSMAKGMARGMESGMAKGEAKIILSMYKNGFSAEQIAAAADKDIEEVEAILAGKELVNE